MLTACLKLLKKALLDRVRAGPALQLLTRFVVEAVDVSQHPKHLVLGGREVDGRIVRRHRSGEGRSSWHQRSPGYPRSTVRLAPNRVLGSQDLTPPKAPGRPCGQPLRRQSGAP